MEGKFEKPPQGSARQAKLRRVSFARKWDRKGDLARTAASGKLESEKQKLKNVSRPSSAF
jgi:hypothetical protein